MSKIRLDVDALTVDSFSTVAGEDSGKGTVFGHLPPYTYQKYCSDGITCNDTCDFCTNATDCGTCGATDCGTCATACGTCNTDCGTCDPYCCCTCSCA